MRNGSGDVKSIGLDSTRDSGFYQFPVFDPPVREFPLRDKVGAKSKTCNMFDQGSTSQYAVRI